MISEIITFDPPFLFVHDDWLEELVRDVFRVVFLKKFDKSVLTSLDFLSDTLYQPIDRDLDAFPTLISIHCIVSADNCGNFTVLKFFGKIDELLTIFGRRAWSRVASVAQEMDVCLRDTLFFCSLEKGEEVVDMRMNSTIRNLQMEVRLD